MSLANTMNERRELFSRNKHTALGSFYRIATATIVLFLYGSLHAQTPITLYNSFSGTINYTVIGGTLRTAANTVNACAIATSSSDTLSVPSDATVLAAYLYWCSSNTTPDAIVMLNSTPVNASRTFSCANPAGNGNILSSGFADITSLVMATGNGLYTFSGITINTSAAYCNAQNVQGGWGMVVVYNQSTEYRHTINIYDGFQAFYGSQIIFSPNNFYVPYSRVDGKLTHFTWEGDFENSASLNGYSENLGFDGQILSDAHNPVNNQFNSASNALNSDSTWGVDIDTYDVTNYLHSGDTSATSVYSSGGDAVWLSCEVISISDTANSDVAITKTCSATGDSIIVGNQMHYYLVVKNNGPDTTGTITVVDTLQPGAKLVSVSASGWQVDSSASPIYTFRHTSAHAPNTTLQTIDMTVYVYYDPASYRYLRNSASVSSPQFDRRPWNNVATKTIKVVTPVFLQTTKTFYDYRHYPNISDTLRYTIRVKNSGNWDVSPAHSNPVTIVDSLPAGFAYIAGAPGTAPTASGNVTNGYVLTWTNVFTTLVQGASDSVRYWVIPNATFTGDSLFINRANVSSPGVKQSVEDTAIPPPIVTINKYFDPGKTKALDTVQYHIILQNTSQYVTSTGTWVRDTIPSSDTVRNVAAWLGGGTLTTAGTTQYITWSNITLAPGAVDTLNFRAKIKYNVNNNTTITNTARDTNAQRYKGSGSVSMTVYQYATGRLYGTSTIQPIDTIYYTLVDEDLNTSTTTKQNITLTDSNKVTNEIENILFTETGANTGIFTGKIATVYGAGAGINNNGIFNVKPGDSLHISYTDQNDSTGVGVNRLKTWTTKVVGGNNATLTATPSIKPGSTISYTLTDVDLNSNPAVIETYTLRDTCKRTSELENIIVTQRSTNDSVFTGSISTVYGTTSDGNNNGHFAVQVGDSIIIKYLDTVNSTGASGGWVYARTYVSGGATALLSTTYQIHPWDSIQVKITDADLNRNSSAIESYTVRDSNMVNQQFQDITVAERSANDSVFTGYVQTRYGVVTGTNNQGYIYVHQGDSLIVSYKDTMNGTGGPGSTLTSKTHVLGGNAASITALASIYAGDNDTIRVTDKDLNRNTLAVESYKVRLYNMMTSEWDSIKVTERNVNDSVFIGTMATTYGITAGINNDGILNVKLGDTLVVSYKDTITYDGAPGNTLTAKTYVKGGNKATLIATATIFPADTVYYVLTDLDLNKNVTVSESYSLRDTSKTGEWENLTFIESGINTGIFSAKIPTVFGTSGAVNNNGIFTVKAGDTLILRYIDTLDERGNRDTLFVKTVVKGGSTATLSDTSQMFPGDSVLVTVKDKDLNRLTGSIESYKLRIYNRVTSEFDSVLFTEKSVNDSVFTGWLRSQFGSSAGSNNDGLLNVKANDTLQITYFDTVDAQGKRDTLIAKTAVKGGFTAALSDTSQMFPGDSILITVKDKDLNKLSGTIESYKLRIYNIVTNEFDSVKVTEKTANDSVFIGWMKTTFGTVAGTNNDGIINVKATDSLLVTYRDTLRSDGSSATLTAKTAVVGGNTASLIITAQIHPGDSTQVTVTDKDLNKLTGSIESYKLRIFNTITNEFDSVKVTERSANDSLFTGWIKTTFGSSAGVNNDGTINVKAADSLLVTYRDTLRTDGSSTTLTAKTAVLGGNTASLTATTTIFPRDSVLVTVTDKDLNKLNGSIESYKLSIYNIITNEFDSVKVTEKTVNDSVFTGWMKTTFGSSAGTNNDGTINIKATDSLLVTYRDTLRTDGSSATLIAKTAVKGGSTATINVNPTLIAANDSSTFSITDADLNKSSSVAEAYSLKIVSSTGEYEVMTFTETGINSDVFTKKVPTISGTTPGTNNDGVFTVQSGDSIIAVYHDSLTVTGDTANIKASFKIGSVNFSTSSKKLVDVNGGLQVPSDTIAYTIKVKNTGTVNSTNAVAIDTIPSGMVVLSPTLPGGTSVSGRVITFNTFNLIVGDSLTLQYSLRIDSTIQSGMPAVNTAYIRGNGADQKLTASFTPSNLPLLKLIKGVDKTSAKPGDTLTYTVTFKNIGTSKATSVVILDGSPTNTTYIPQSVKLNSAAKTDQADSDEIVVTSGNITVSIIGDVLPGQQGVVTFKVRIN